jgi:flavin reductase (DIM6/NTAB) family NADH-FMN oxidoreductase RutF
MQRLIASELVSAMNATSFREVLKDFAAGVTIVTSADEHGVPVGATVSSFASLSLEPPLVLVCLKSDSRTVAAIRERGAFSVHILERSQSELARRFAAELEEKFRPGSYELNSAGVPCLSGCKNRLDCRLENDFSGGDHRIMVGRVESTLAADAFRPLVYAQRGFFGLGEPVSETK